MCAQRRLRLAQSDLSLRCPHDESLCPHFVGFVMRRLIYQIRFLYEQSHMTNLFSKLASKQISHKICHFIQCPTIDVKLNSCHTRFCAASVKIKCDSLKVVSVFFCFFFFVYNFANLINQTFVFRLFNIE